MLGHKKESCCVAGKEAKMSCAWYNSKVDSRDFDLEEYYQPEHRPRLGKGFWRGVLWAAVALIPFYFLVVIIVLAWAKGR